MFTRRIAAVLAALSMLVTWVMPAPALAASEYVPQETSYRTLVERSGGQVSRNVAPGASGQQSYSKQYYYEQLDGPSRAVYDAILASPLGQGPSTNRVTVNMTHLPSTERTIIASFEVRKAVSGGEDEVNSPECAQFCADTIDPALTALMFDHSELSWLRNTEYACSLAWNGRVTYNLGGMQPGETRVFSNYTLVVTGLDFEITPTGYAWATLSCDSQSGPDKYNYANTENLARIQQALGTAVAEIGDLSSRPVPERIQAIHDWVCTHMDYADKSSARFINEWRGYQTAYSALVEGTTVCAGYCAAFKLLCDAYDVPCVIVRGLDGEGGAHVWNYVMVDGQWYGVDCTWDDIGQEPVYDFFLRGSQNFLAPATPGYHEECLLFDPYRFAYPILAQGDYVRPVEAAPKPDPVVEPTQTPSAEPTPVPTPEPTPVPTPEPSQIIGPTMAPSGVASASPSAAPTAAPAFWPPLRAAENAGTAFELNSDMNGTYLTGFAATTDATTAQLAEDAEIPHGMELRIVNADGTGTANDTPVSTGQRVQVLDTDGDIAWVATVVVRGDVIGTGRLALSQLVQMGRQLTRRDVLEGPYLMAADLTGDGAFTISDLVAQAAALARQW